MSGISSIGAISSLVTGQVGAIGGAGTMAGNVGGIGGAAAPAAAPSGASIGSGTDAAGGSFIDSLSNAFGSLNSQLVGADASMADFAAGGSADLHTVMLEMQEAGLGLKTGIAIRDRLLEAYQEIMRLSI